MFNKRNGGVSMIKNTALGGTDWADGEVLYSVDLNDTFDAGVIHRKQFSDATSRNHTGDTDWTDSGTVFTFSAPANSLILGGFFSCNLGHDGAGGSTGGLNIKITGATMTTSYLIGGRFYVEESGQVDSWMPRYSTGEDYLWKMIEETSGMFTTYIPPMKIEDATTTFTIRIITSNSGDTTTISAATMDLIYVPVFKDD